MRSHQSRGAVLARATRALAVTTLVVAAVGCGSSSDSDSFTALPDVALTDAGGAAVSSGDLVGEPLVINFWYSTCAPCTKELADFAEVHDEVGDEVRFVGVNPLDDPATMVSFAAARGVEYDLYQDPVAELQIELGITSFPATVFVEPGGGIVATTGVLDADELRARVDDLLRVGAGDDVAAGEVSDPTRLLAEHGGAATNNVVRSST